MNRQEIELTDGMKKNGLEIRRKGSTEPWRLLSGLTGKYLHIPYVDQPFEYREAVSDRPWRE